jgi:hypothetical protein
MSIQCILLKNNTVLISQIEQVGSELGEPDCKLVNPIELVDTEDEDAKLRRWPTFTDQKVLMIHSDSILTLVEPNQHLIKAYNDYLA